MGVCRIEGCGRIVLNKSQQLCNRHYLKLKRHGDPLYVKEHIARLCAIPGCGKKHDTAGYCHSHYNRYKRYGNPFGGKETYRGDPARWILEHLEYDGEDCLIWPFSRHQFGYGEIRIDGRTELVHVIVNTIVNGPRPTQKHETLHSCGNGHLGCCSRKHIRWGTRKENVSDSMAHGTRPLGEEHCSSKLKVDDVLKIRKDSRTQRAIAAEYNIAQTHVGLIKRRKTWSWLS